MGRPPLSASSSTRFAVPLRVCRALLVAGMAAACGQPEPDASDTHATAYTATRDAANAFNERMPGAGADDGALPSDCETYLAEIDACVARLGATSDAGRQLKQGVNEARRAWATADDHEAIGEMCRQAVADLATSAGPAGCS